MIGPKSNCHLHALSRDLPIETGKMQMGRRSSRRQQKHPKWARLPGPTPQARRPWNQAHIGAAPIAAFGNSDGDLQMLQWTAAGSGPRFCLCVHHTDAERASGPTTANPTSASWTRDSMKRRRRVGRS